MFATRSLARLALASLLTLAGPLGCGEAGLGTGIDEAGDELDGDEGTGTEEAVPRASGPLRFSRACERGTRVTVAAVGDVLLHGPLQRQAVARANNGRFRSLWAPIEPLLQQASVTYANLEGPTAAGVNSAGRSVTDPGLRFDGVVYSSYPMFNYHPTLLDDLMTSGVDVVSTSNNHSLDRRSLGADRTIDELEERSLPFTGTRRAGDTTSKWYTFTTSNGVRIAWVACTYGTNGIPDPQRQVRLCYSDTAAIESDVRALAADRSVHAVIVTPHWGAEYTHTPDRMQRAFAQRMVNAGATALIGAHPHVLQPWEKLTDASGREAFVIYSLGNFVSNQSQLPRASTVLLYLGLTLGADGRAFVNGARYVPMYMSRPTSTSLELIAADDGVRRGASRESRTHSMTIYGHWNAMASGDALNTTPECE